MHIKESFKRILFPISIALLAINLIITFASARQTAFGKAGSSDWPQPPATIPPERITPARPVAVSAATSYYNIPAQAFTPDRSYDHTNNPLRYVFNTDGCLQMESTGIMFSAPVYLPEGSQVFSMTMNVYGWSGNNGSSSTFDQYSDSGWHDQLLLAISPDGVEGWQHIVASDSIITIDTRNWSYAVRWTANSPYPSNMVFCGIRLAYHAPAGMLFMPYTTR